MLAEIQGTARSNHAPAHSFNDCADPGNLTSGSTLEGATAINMPITLWRRQMRRASMGSLRRPRGSRILPGRDVRLSQSRPTELPNDSGTQEPMANRSRVPGMTCRIPRRLSASICGARPSTSIAHPLQGSPATGANLGRQIAHESQD